MMLQGMEGFVFGIHVDHGEGRLHFPDEVVHGRVIDEGMAAVAFVDDDGQPTERYPFNPNGSPGGLTGICSPDGRYLAMMLHPERTFLTWQAHWLPEEMKGSLAPLPGSRCSRTPTPGVWIAPRKRFSSSQHFQRSVPSLLSEVTWFVCDQGDGALLRQLRFAMLPAQRTITLTRDAVKFVKYGRRSFEDTYLVAIA